MYSDVIKPLDVLHKFLTSQRKEAEALRFFKAAKKIQLSVRSQKVLDLLYLVYLFSLTNRQKIFLQLYHLFKKLLIL